MCQELGIYQAIWCLSFPLFLSLSITRNNVSYITRIFYMLSCLVSSCPSFSPLVVNNLFCDIVIEICRVPVIISLTRLTKIVGIRIIHSKDLSTNFDTTILGLKPTLQLEIILPHTVAITNPQISGIISFIHPWQIYLNSLPTGSTLGLSYKCLSLSLS